jgi:hypothetical protein
MDGIQIQYQTSSMLSMYISLKHYRLFVGAILSTNLADPRHDRPRLASDRLGPLETFAT